MNEKVFECLFRFSTLLPLLLLGGCNSLLTYALTYHSYAPITFLVIDGETGKPIPDAAVDVYYGGGDMRIAKPQEYYSQHTDESGRLDLKVATGEDPYVKVSAREYRDISLEPHALCRASNPVILPLYRLPVPHITVILPEAYHGPVRINLHPVPGLIQEKAGQREFIYHASSTGYVDIPATNLLQNLVLAMNFLSIRETDGSPIPSATEFALPSDRTLRLIGNQDYLNGGMRLVYAVGTTREAEAVSFAIYPARPDSPSGLFRDANPKALDAYFESTGPAPVADPSFLPAYLTIVLPNDYRGLVKINLRPARSPTREESAKRDFIYHSTENGYVEIEAPPRLLYIDKTRINVRYEDGKEFPSPSEITHLPQAEIFPRFVGFDNPNGSCQYLFMLGTGEESTAIYNRLIQNRDREDSWPIDHKIFAELIMKP